MRRMGPVGTMGLRVGISVGGVLLGRMMPMTRPIRRREDSSWPD